MKKVCKATVFLSHFLFGVERGFIPERKCAKKIKDILPANKDFKQIQLKQ